MNMSVKNAESEASFSFAENTTNRFADAEAGK